jgi:hypothetical protein
MLTADVSTLAWVLTRLRRTRGIDNRGGHAMYRTATLREHNLRPEI